MKINPEDVKRAGLVTVCARFKKSRQAPEERRYEGVPFRELAAHTGEAISGESVCVFKAADGFSVALIGEEALDPAQCFIAVSEAGAPLLLENGQPYCMMLMLGDNTSQRWCRYLEEVDVRE